MTLKPQSLRALALLACTGLALTQFSCSKPESEIVEEEELITTLSLTLTDSLGVSQTFTFRDTDGDGGNNPVRFDTLQLKAGYLYSASIQILNESVTPAEDITTEILEEKDDHLFCFTSPTVNVTATDVDSKGLKVGIQSKVISNTVGSSNLIVSLKHQPGIKNGNCDLGETDIEINFPVKTL